MSNIGKFAKSVLHSWGSAMSGIPSVPLAVAALYVSNARLKVMFGLLAAILWFVCAYLVWAKEHDSGQSVSTELEALKQKYFDDRPRIAFIVNAPETAKEWKDLLNRQTHAQFFELQHIGGRAATCVRIAPIRSASGVFELRFSEVAVVSGPHPQPIKYVVDQPPFLPIDGLNDTIEMLRQFFMFDNPERLTRLEYDVAIHFQDGDTPRIHRHTLVCTRPGPRLTIAPAA